MVENFRLMVESIRIIKFGDITTDTHGKGGIVLGKLLRAAQAGTVESNDIMISVAPGEAGSGCAVTLVSPVLQQYGRQIKAVMEAGAKENGIDDIIIQANDRGALDCTIRSRLNVAIQRALAPEEVTKK